jgi:hypothetical protein
VAGFTALPHENVNDIVEGCYTLGMPRAALLGKNFEEGVDISHAMSYFCWWLFKPKPSENIRIYMQEHRWELFAGAYENDEVRGRIIQAVPERELIMSIDDLFESLRSGSLALPRF